MLACGSLLGCFWETMFVVIQRLSCPFLIVLAAFGSAFSDSEPSQIACWLRESTTRLALSREERSFRRPTASSEASSHRQHRADRGRPRRDALPADCRRDSATPFVPAAAGRSRLLSCVQLDRQLLPTPTQTGETHAGLLRHGHREFPLPQGARGFPVPPPAGDR